MAMDLSSVHFTDILEFPAFVKDGELRFVEPGLRNAEESKLKLIASAMEATLVWIKFRGTFNEPEQRFCIYKKCYSLAEKNKDWCESHDRKQ